MAELLRSPGLQPSIRSLTPVDYLLTLWVLLDPPDGRGEKDHHLIGWASVRSSKWYISLSRLSEQLNPSVILPDSGDRRVTIIDKIEIEFSAGVQRTDHWGIP